MTDYRDKELPTGKSYRVIFPKGDLSKLSIAEIWDYQKDEWKIASRKIFQVRSEAVAYARDLAKTNQLEFEGNEPEDFYLD